MNLSALFSSTAHYTQPTYFFVFKTKNWAALRDCKVTIDAFGGSASGAAGRNGNLCTTGGGAGARCKKTVDLKAGDVLSITIGAGGLGVSPPGGTNSALNGNDGGSTTVTGPNGLSMNAGGGKGGKYAISPAGANGGDGGIATGGDENYPGGRGGNIVAALSGTPRRATGGGALPLKGNGFRGGDILPTISAPAATGGAGVGGNGGDLSAAASADAATGGGGSSDDAPIITNGAGLGGRGILGTVAGDAPTPLIGWFRTSGPGSAGIISTAAVQTAVPGNGAGSGGAFCTSSNNASSANPVSFGGSGAALSAAGNVATSGGKSAGSSLIGGTGAANCGGNNPATSGDAGDGFVVLEVW